MDESISRLIKHRERFQSWCLVISFLSLISAIWVRAPTLEVDIPLFAGAKASVNAGYIVAVAPTFIAFSMCWVIGALVSMRKYQNAFLNSENEFNEWDKIAICGPLNVCNYPNSRNLPKFLTIEALMRKTRLFVFFILPVISQMVIINTMFSDLAYYNKREFISKIFESTDDNISSAMKFSPKDVKNLGYWTFFSKSTAEKGADYTLSFSELNSECGMFFYLEVLDSKGDNLTSKESSHREQLRKKNPKCVPVEFPDFNLALNTWLNILMLLVTVVVSYVGSNIYFSKSLNNKFQSKTEGEEEVFE